MPTEFPGMNPYLEDAYFWHRFHTAFAVRLSEVLNEALPVGYVAAAEQCQPQIPALTTEVFERYVEIRTAGRNEKRVVTIVEMLSPGNKAPGSSGRREYLLKQQEILHSDTHLMEIDLLRFGAHTVAAPLLRLPARDTWDYIISLHRWTDRFHFGFWLNQLSEPLPEVQIPLLPDDADIIIDLQAVFDHVYRAGRYADEIDLSAPLPTVYS